MPRIMSLAPMKPIIPWDRLCDPLFKSGAPNVLMLATGLLEIKYNNL